MKMKTRFETEAKGNSEMTYSHLISYSDPTGQAKWDFVKKSYKNEICVRASYLFKTRHHPFLFKRIFSCAFEVQTLSQLEMRF